MELHCNFYFYMEKYKTHLYRTISFYLPSTSIVLEIQHPERFGNYHFQNIAHFMGLSYYSLPGSSFLSKQDMDGIVNKVKESIKVVKKFSQ